MTEDTDDTLTLHRWIAHVVGDRDEAEAKLAAIEALVKDTDGDWLPGGAFDGLVGEIQAVILRRTA